MALKKVISADDAVALIRNGDAVASSGYGGNGNPEALFAAIERRFLAGSGPRDLTLVWAGGQGDGKERGLNRLGHEGLLKRTIGGHYGLIPKIEALAVANKVEAYNLPEGVITHLYRDIAAGKPGTVSQVGIGTFVDPRVEGAKVNAAATEDLIEVIRIAGEDHPLFRAFPIHVALIRGTTADPDGNVTMERESLRLETLAMALAARNSGGVVICQVERIAQSGSLDARRVRVPGILVDAVVEAGGDEHMQNYGTRYSPALSGEVRIPLARLKPLPLETTILALIADKVDITLVEIGEHLVARHGERFVPSTIWRCLDRHGQTLKKNSARQRAGTARRRRAASRLARRSVGA